MAETVEGLLTEVGTDVSGLDRGLTESLGLLTRFATTVGQIRPTVDVDTSPATTSLGNLRTSIDQFVREARDVSAVPFLNTAEARQEIQELIAEFPGLTRAIRGIDPTGILSQTALQAREAAQALLNAQTTPTAAGPSSDTAGQAARLTAAFESEQAASIGAAQAMDRLTAADAQQAIAALKSGAASAEAARQAQEQARAAQLAAEQITQAQRLTAATPPRTVPTLLASQEDTTLAQNADANAAAFERMARAQQDAAVQSAALSAAIQGTVTFSERQAAAAAQAATGISAQARAVQAAAAATTAAGAAGAGPLAAAALGAATATNTLAAAETRAEAGTRTWGAGLALAERQLATLAAAEAAAATGAGRITAGFAAASAQRAELDALAAGAEAGAAGVGRLSQSAEGLLQSGEHGARALRSIAQATAIVGAEAIGVQGPLVRAAEGVILFAGGIGPLLALGVAVGGLGLLYDAVTKKTREGQKATEDFIKAQDTAFRNRDIVGSIREAFSGADVPGRTIEGLTDRLAKLQAQLASATRGVETFDQATGGIKFTVDDSKVANIQQQIQAVKNAALQTGLGFLDPILAAQRSAADQATRDTLAITQQGITQRLDAVKAGFAQELSSRAQFTTQSMALAGQAAAADLAALQAELGRAQAARDHASIRDNTGQLINPVAVAEAQAQVNSLTAQITLRRNLLGLQTQQIANEKILADQALLIQSGIGFVGVGAGGAPVNIGTTFAPESLIDTAPTIKPRFDLTQVERDVAGVAAATNRINLDLALDRATRAGEALTPILVEVGLSLRDIGNANISRTFTSLSDALRELTDVTSVAASVGLIGDEAARSIESVLQLSDALQKVAESASTGNILGAITAGISVLGSLFGESPAEREHNQRIRENTDAINHLALVAERQGAAITAAQVRTAVTSAEDTRIVKDNMRLSPEEITNAVNRQIAASGLDVTDLAEIARRHGIEILDSHGNVDPVALHQFDQAVLDGTISLTDLTDAANSASEAMRNIPDVFRVDAARAAVESAEPRPLPQTAPAPGATNASVAVTGTPSAVTTTTVQTSIGTVTIIVQGAKDPAATAKTVREEFEKLAMRRNGQVDDWGVAQNPNVPHF